MASDNNNSQKKLSELQELCQHKDSIIETLAKEVEQQRVREEILVEAKTAKIKEWVASRLKELEEQNERLRTQNLKCAQQLELLKTCAENTALWKSSLLTGSVEGSLLLTASCTETTKRGSDDSGTTSDINTSYIDESVEWPLVSDQSRTASVERILTVSTSSVKTSTRFHQATKTSSTAKDSAKSQQRLSRSLTGKLGDFKPPKIPNDSRTLAVVGYRKPAGKTAAPVTDSRVNSLRKLSSGGKSAAQMITQSLPRSWSKRPVPTPRGVANKNPKDLLMAEEPNPIGPETSGYPSSGLSDSLIDRDSLCNYATSRDSEDDYVDYVNVERICPVRNYDRHYATGACATSKALRSESMSTSCYAAKTDSAGSSQQSSWEKKLYLMAQTHLSTSVQPRVRESIFSAYEPYGKFTNTLMTSVPSGTTATTTASSNGDRLLAGPMREKSFTHIAVPVFSTSHGKVSRLRSARVTGGEDSSTEPESSHSRHYTSGSSNDRCSGSSMGTRNHLKSGWENGGKSSSSSKGSKSFEERLSPEKPHSREIPYLGVIGDVSSDEDDYAIPPDACGNYPSSSSHSQMHLAGDSDSAIGQSVKCLTTDGNSETVISGQENGLAQLDKWGFLNKIGDRTKSLKRRWFVVRDATMSYYKAQSDEGKRPLGTVPFSDLLSVTSISVANGGPGFELVTAKGTHRLASESPNVTEEWIKFFQKIIKENVRAKMSEQLRCRLGSVTGWMTKVKYGHSKCCWCLLVDRSLMFFKSPNDKVPMGQLNLKGAHIQEVNRSSDESGSDDAEAVHSAANSQFSISVQVAKQEPTYLLLTSKEERDKWLYHLNVASGTVNHSGTAFENHIQKLMESSGEFNSDLWSNPVLSGNEPSLTEPLTSLSCDKLKKEALNLYKSCFLFCSVPIQMSAVDYHVSLLQNCLAQGIGQPEIQNELICQLVKLTLSSLPGIQSWQLLCLALSLFIPDQYSVTWLLRKHLERMTTFSNEESKYAVYCQRVLERCLLNGPRHYRPSRIESIAMLTRKPYDHCQPYSLPVNFMDGTYRISEFDGSSTVQEVLDSLTVFLGIRPSPESGFTLFSDDAQVEGLETALGPNEIICDIISRWEQALMEHKTGKFPSNKLIKIICKKRFHWKNHSEGETARESILLAYQTHSQLLQSNLGFSREFFLELCALMARVHSGDGTCDSDSLIHTAFEKFYPHSLKVSLTPEEESKLRKQLKDCWTHTNGLKAVEAAKVYLNALKLWPHYGAQLFDATMKWRAEERIKMAVSDHGVSLLTIDAMELIVFYPYENILTFGGCREDFMLVTSRIATGDGEPSKDRLIFSLDKPQILVLTLLIADYIKFRKVQQPKKLNTNSRSPRRVPTRLNNNNSGGKSTPHSSTLPRK